MYGLHTRIAHSAGTALTVLSRTTLLRQQEYFHLQDCYHHEKVTPKLSVQLEDEKCEVRFRV